MLPDRCIVASGPKDASIMIVGEAPGEEEQMFGLPFVGPSGRELNRMLEEAGIDTNRVYKTNVFHCRPPDNKLEHFCGPRSDAIPGLPPVKAGQYIRNEFLPEYLRLENEIMQVRPNVIVPMGNIALAALLGRSGIGKIRGTTMMGKLGFKLLPTYHPAAVLRQWAWRVIVVSDLRKVKNEQAFPEVRIPSRRVLIDPTIFELEMFYDNYLDQADEVSVDIETKHGFIRCVGFAPSIDIACVVPFYDRRYSDNSYWRSEGEEIRAMQIVWKVLRNKAVKKVMQNGAYDLQWLWKLFHTPIYGWGIDTTLAHHALYPEMEKNLGFLGSVYTTEPSWKMMRTRSDEVKKED